MLNAKKLRILFIDDDKLELITTLRQEGYDVEHWEDVENLEKIVDGRYHVVFLDVRGIGEKYGGNGLDVLKYVSEHNPMVFTIVFSAKPFNGQESDLIRKHAKRSMDKDCTFYEISELLDEYAKSINADFVLQQLNKTVKLGFFDRRRIKNGQAPSEKTIEKLAKSSGIGSDAIKIISNTTSIAASLVKIVAGVGV